MADLSARGLEYLMQQRSPARWADVLTALAESLVAQMSESDLASFFSVLGRRVARNNPVQADSLEGLDDAANRFLALRGWGSLHVQDAGDHLVLVLLGAPLQSGFGAYGLQLGPQFFAGLLSEWLEQLGADSALRLSVQNISASPLETVTYRFSL